MDFWPFVLICLVGFILFSNNQNGGNNLCGCLILFFFIFIGFKFLAFIGISGILVIIILFMLMNWWGQQKVKDFRQNRVLNEEKRKEIDMLILSIFAKIAKADGVVDQNEADFIKQIISQRFSQYPHDSVREVFNSARDNEISYKTYVDELAQKLQFHIMMRPSILGLFCELAAASGKVTQSELNILLYIEQNFGINGYVRAYFYTNGSGGGNQQYQHPNSAQNLDECYRVLGCDEKSSDNEIKKAYRAKCKEFHPDILTGKGAAQHIIEQAKKEQQRINVAYENIKKHRGFN